ncbi:hypothetical protein NPX13_g7622 [Xylaria arbuscula]|uniref:Uncharacterized protein n=1 Tax=Xylaria arbuscula TaxID=114810 RepID=A0A9W8TKL5_9PEZI|nr:hypothetical protein NPX13_g7622 [Xylaria arbuscula]
MDEALCSILCGEDYWHYYSGSRSIKFNSDGTGELELIPYICAQLEWQSTKRPSLTNETPRSNEPQILGEVELEITLKRMLPERFSPQEKEKWGWINASTLHDDAFKPKLFKVRIERGHFMEPIYLSSQRVTRYSLLLIFDQSPFSIESQWNHPEGGPESNEFWNHKEFVGRKDPTLERQGRAMNDTSPWRRNECVVS